jgi:hypothetical protein
MILDLYYEAIDRVPEKKQPKVERKRVEKLRDPHQKKAAETIVKQKKMKRAIKIATNPDSPESQIAKRDIEKAKKREYSAKKTAVKKAEKQKAQNWRAVVAKTDHEEIPFIDQSVVSRRTDVGTKPVVTQIGPATPIGSRSPPRDTPPQVRTDSKKKTAVGKLLSRLRSKNSR